MAKTGQSKPRHLVKCVGSELYFAGLIDGIEPVIGVTKLAHQAQDQGSEQTAANMAALLAYHFDTFSWVPVFE